MQCHCFLSNVLAAARVALGAQWVFDKRRRSTFNTQATPASRLTPDPGKLGHLFGKGNGIHQDRISEWCKLTTKQNKLSLLEKLQLYCKDARMSGNG